jgi:hypothetical protein
MLDAQQAAARLPVHAGDPPEVFVEQARLLAWYSEHIGRDVEKIIAQCGSAAEQRVAAAAYLAEIGSNIPDRTIRATVRRLAALKFRTLGVDVQHPIAGQCEDVETWVH